MPGVRNARLTGEIFAPPAAARSTSPSSSSEPVSKLSLTRADSPGEARSTELTG